MITFNETGLSPEILRALTDMGFENPTPIQEKTLPQILESKNDLVALAQTGTGKTAAFGLPVIQLTDISDRDVQTLILCPTRELGLQITKDLQNFTKYIKYLDHSFVTSDPKSLGFLKKFKCSFMPIPVDENIEYLNCYNNKKPIKDIFFTMSHGVNKGVLRTDFYTFLPPTDFNEPAPRLVR